MVENYTVNQIERDFKGVWLPKEIWLDKRLTPLEKIILMEIDSLDSDERGCYASNKYLAEFCQCSEVKISNAISKLKKLGYLYLQSFDGRQRELKSGLKKNIRQPLEIEENTKNFSDCLIKNISAPHKKYKSTLKKVREINIENNIEINKENTLSNERVKESERETHSHTPKKEKKKSEKKAEKKPKTKPEKKQIYGEFKNVFLSDTEIAILKTEYPGEYLEKIERLSKYIETTGKKYKNHFVVIRDWIREDTKPNTQNSYDLDAYEGETDFLSDLNAKYKQDEESLDYLKGL